MTKRIDIYNNETLADLNWKEGEILAVHNTDPNHDYAIALCIPKDLALGLDLEGTGDRGSNLFFYTPPFIGISYAPKFGEKEFWEFELSGKILMLRRPEQRHGQTKNPIFEYGKKLKRPYEAETVLSGREALLDYLREDKLKANGFDLYADCIEDGRLQLERCRLGKFLDSIPMIDILTERAFPPIARFRDPISRGIARILK